MIKTIQKWSVAWVQHNRRQMIEEEDPHKYAEVDNTEDAEDGHTEMGMAEKQDEQTGHHKMTPSEEDGG